MNADQYNAINSFLSEFSSLSAALETAEAEIKTVQLEAAKDLLPKYAAAKVALGNLENTLRKLSDKHYTELFPEDKRSHKTPFGEIKYHKSSSLEVADEEKAILKIKLACNEELARESEGKPPRFTQEQLIRTREELNLESLGEMDDSTLALFGIVRVSKDNFKVVPFDLRSDKPARKEPRTLEAA